jgi:hypothetical protein
MFSTKLTTVCAAGVFATIGAAAASASDQAAPLAQLTSLAGDVLVEQGGAIAPAESGMQLAALDRVLVLEEGRATLAFGDGCLDEVTGPAMRTITAAGTCAETASGATSLTDVATDAVTGQDALAVQQVATSQYFGDDDRRLGLLILGGLGLGGVIWAATSDDDDNSRSVVSAPPQLSP